MEGDVKQSTSAVDVCCCFGQVIEFWRHLEWPDLPAALPYVAKITEVSEELSISKVVSLP